MNSRNGSIVLWVVLGIFALGAALFFISAPFNAKTKAAYRHATQWTPKRIQADPAGYLTWAMHECAEFRATLESHRLSLLTRRHAVGRAREEAEARRNSASALLDEAKALYRKAEAHDAWPVIVESNTVTQQEFQNRIVRLYSAQDRHKRLAIEYERLKSIISLRLSTLAERIAEVDDLQAWLASNIELVSLSQSVEEFRGLHDRVTSLLDMSRAVGEAHKAPGIDEVVNDHVEIAAKQKSFVAIMQEAE